jgi:hypothetical protein
MNKDENFRLTLYYLKANGAVSEAFLMRKLKVSYTEAKRLMEKGKIYQNQENLLNDLLLSSSG